MDQPSRFLRCKNCLETKSPLTQDLESSNGAQCCHDLTSKGFDVGAGEGRRTAESERSKGCLHGPSRPLPCHSAAKHPSIENTLENVLSFPKLSLDGNFSHSPTAYPSAQPCQLSRCSSFCPTRQLRCWLISRSLFKGWTTGQPAPDDFLPDSEPGGIMQEITLSLRWQLWVMGASRWVVLRLNMTEHLPQWPGTQKVQKVVTVTASGTCQPASPGYQNPHL